MSEDTTPSWAPTRWKHRRRMAYGGMGFSVFSWATGLYLGISFITHAEAVIIPLCTMGFWGGMALPVAYMGNNAIENFAAIRSAGK